MKTKGKYVERYGKLRENTWTYIWTYMGHIWEIYGKCVEIWNLYGSDTLQESLALY
jgi:hypothetical protein